MDALATQTQTQTQMETVPPPGAPAPAPDQRLQLSVDGALVPLVGGVWEEVKTLVVGELDAAGHAQALSYFSRLSDHLTFSRQATVEWRRTGAVWTRRPPSVP